MDQWKRDRIKSAADGTNPTVIMRMKSGFAVFGDTQFLPGYCVLLAYPRAESLNSLPLSKRIDFLSDMSFIGDAIEKSLEPVRINYDILGNTDAFLHAHIFPRYAWEEDRFRSMPVWLYPKECWTAEENQFHGEAFSDVRMRITAELEALYAGICEGEPG